MRSHWVQMANWSGGQVADAFDLDGRQGEMAAVAPIAHQTGGTHTPETGPQELVAVGQLIRQFGRPFGPLGLLLLDRRMDLGIGHDDGRLEPGGFLGQGLGFGAVPGQGQVQRFLLLEEQELVLLELSLASAQLVDLMVHGLQVAGGGHPTRPHPLLDLVTPPGRGGDVLFQRRLAAGQVVHQDLDLGHGRGDLGQSPAHPAQLGPLGQRLHPVPQLVEDGVVRLHLQQRFQRLGHQLSSLPAPGHPVVGGPASLRAVMSAPPSASSAMASASSHVNQATSWLSPGPGAGSASGESHQVPEIEMHVVPGRPVHVDMDGHRAPGRVGHRQPGLLHRLAHGSIGRGLPRFDVATGLQPPVEPPMTVQDGSAGPDHDGRGGDVGQIGVPVQGPIQSLQLGQHDGDGERLTLIHRPVAPEPGRQVPPGRIGSRSARVRTQADFLRWRWIRRRSRSVVPPQIPSRSLLARACSRQDSRTGHWSQMVLASPASSSETG